MMKNSIATLSVAALALTLAACSDRPLTGDLSAVPGELVVQLRAASPGAAPLGAIRFTVRGGEIAQVSAADPAFTVFTSLTDGGTSVVVIANALQGALVRVRVPDVRAVRAYHAVIAEAVDRDNRPIAIDQGGGGGYELAIGVADGRRTHAAARNVVP